MKQNGLFGKVHAFSEDSGIGTLLRSAETVIVGYSGGADSTFLLHFLTEACPGVTVVAAHLHHGIRGAEADRDEAFCRETCERLDVRLLVGHEDVPALAAQSGESLETAARTARYAFFEKTAARLRAESGGGVLVATAHTADDNLETVLFRLLRGSGSRGLGGIPPVRDGHFIRPLLCLSGAEIRDFCRAAALPFVEDSTNGETAYTRNYLRAAVVPLLRRVVPDPEAAALRSATLCRSDDDCLQRLATERLGVYADGARVPLELLRQHPAIASRMVARLYANAAPAGASLTKTHTDAVLGQLSGAPRTAYLHLPGGVTFRRTAAEAAFLKPGTAAAEPYELPLPDAGELLLPGYRLFVGKVPEEQKNIYKLAIYASIRFDTMIKPVIVRSRRPGDVYRLGGMTRQVRKMLSERKLSPEERASLPLLCAGDTVVWVPGFAPADGYRNGERELLVTVTKQEKGVGHCDAFQIST